MVVHELCHIHIRDHSGDFWNEVDKVMQAKLIKTETEYDRALSRIDELMDASPDTNAGDELELLATLVELYEEKKYPVDLPDAVSAIRFRMEQQGLVSRLRCCCKNL